MRSAAVENHSTIGDYAMRARTTLLPRAVVRFSILSGALMLTALGAGCSQTMPDRAERMTRGYVYYMSAYN